jgi:hypothetical protein
MLGGEIGVGDKRRNARSDGSRHGEMVPRSDAQEMKEAALDG